MGVNVDRNVVFLGDRTNRKQGILGVPAQNVANKPGIINLQTVSGTTVADTYIWPNTSGVLRYGTTIPTDIDSDGTAVGSGAAGATTALSNLASVAVNSSIIADSNNDTDLGSNTYAWRSAYIGTSLIFKEATANATVVAADHAVARTYTFPDAGAAATIMLNTGAANAVTFTNGTSNITIGAAGVIDVAAAKTVNIDMDFTVNTEAVTLNQSLSTTDAVAFATGSAIGNLTLADGSITDSGGAISFGNENLTTTGTINVGSDNVNITVGASGATDSRIFFDGAGNLKFYDSNLGVARSLTELYSGTTLNPAVSGDLSITDGKFTWTNSVDEASNAVWTFAGTDKTDISIVSAITTGTSLLITADACANGKLLNLDTDGGPGASGYYIYTYNGAASEFSVGVSGTVLAGTTGDIGHKFSRNNATGTAPVVEIEQTHATGGVGFLVDQNATGDVNAIEIENAGTGYAVTSTAAAAGGGGFEYIAAASGTGKGLFLDGTTGSYVGADNTGLAEITSDGVLLAGANLLRVTSSGLNAAGSFLVEIEQTGKVVAATDGICLKISETGAATATSYAVCIASTSNEALHVDTGVSLFDERVTITLADNTGPALAITNPDTTGNTNAVTITPSGSGAGLLISPQEADTMALSIVGKTAATVALAKIDGSDTDGWFGANNVGMLHLVNDGTYSHVGASMLYIGNSGVPQNDSTGHCLRIIDTGNAAAGTMAYPVYISSNDATVGGVYITTAATGIALNVAAGTANFGGIANFAAGLKTVVAVTDVADPPTQNNMVTAFGAAATAGAGFVGFLNDANAGVNTWLCVSSGASWYYVAKMTAGL